MTTSPKKIWIEKVKFAILCSMFALILLMAIGYAYFVNQTVLNVVKREKIEEETALIVSKISQMEGQYINMIDEIDKELAYNKGYREPEKTTFISRNLSVKSFSLNESEE